MLNFLLAFTNFFHRISFLSYLFCIFEVKLKQIGCACFNTSDSSFYWGFFFILDFQYQFLIFFFIVFSWFLLSVDILQLFQLGLFIGNSMNWGRGNSMNSFLFHLFIYFSLLVFFYLYLDCPKCTFSSHH